MFSFFTGSSNTSSTNSVASLVEVDHSQFYFDDEFFDEAMKQMQQNDGWELQASKGEHLKLFTKNLSLSEEEGSSLVIASKVMAMFKADFQDGVTIALDIPLRKQWSSNTAEAKYIHQDSSKNRDICYFAVKSPNKWLMSPRDFCTVRRYKLSQNELFLVAKSIDHPHAPQRTAEGFIRGRFHIQAFYLREVEVDGSKYIKFTAISQVDYGGWIPAMVITGFMKLFPEMISKEMEKAIELVKQRRMIKK